MADKLVSGGDLREDPLTAAHADWAEGFAPNYTFTADSAMDIVRKETGLVFAQVLECAGVYKHPGFGGPPKPGCFFACHFVSSRICSSRRR